MQSQRVKPEVSQVLTLTVLGNERISPNFTRITLGGGDIASFRYLGFDQWFRLFIPVSSASLERLPNKLDTLSYLKFLAISKTDRPVLRNYTVRAYREAGINGPELDVDFVLHGSADNGTAGPAASWAESCAPGDTVAILDEGIAFNPAADVNDFVIVSDETGLPAVAGILNSLPSHARGIALVELPSAEDAQELPHPPGVTLRWVVRDDPHATPGRAVLAAAERLDLPRPPVYGWVVGEQSLVVGLRRHWVKAGVPKSSIMFCGYWRAPKDH